MLKPEYVMNGRIRQVEVEVKVLHVYNLDR